MSQTVWSSINPNTTSGTQLAVLLDDFKNAIMSGLSGTTRPSETQAAGGWIDTTNEATPNFYWSYKVYDGTNDIEIFRINLNTLKASFPTTDSFFEIFKQTADADGALLKFIKQRIANNGQVLTDDVIMDIQAVGRAVDSSDPVVARIRVESLDDMTATETGATIIFEATPTGSATIVEIFRLIDGKMGIGTETPVTTLEVQGTGIQSTRVEDATTPGLLSIQKKRIAGTGATQNGDFVGMISHKTTDDASASNEVFEIETQALEAHDASNQGTKVTIRNTDVGSATASDAIEITDKIEDIKPSKINALELAAQDVATTTTIAALDTTNSIVRLTGSTDTVLQGIDATGKAKILTIHNSSTANITINNEDASASAANRIVLPGSTSIGLSPGQAIILFYSLTDSRWKIMSSTSGSGSGQGGINYIENSDFEINADGWVAYDDGASATPASGDGAANLLELDLDSINVLRGTQSLNIHKTAANVQGEGVSYDFAIDPADINKRLFVSFDYSIDVATYVNGDKRVFIYDIDNTALIGAVTNDDDGDIIFPGQDIASRFNATFEATTSLNYRLIIHQTSTNANDDNLKIDNVKVSPDTLVPGAIVTEWETVSLTVNNFSNDAAAARMRRVGDSLEVEATFDISSVSGNMEIILPNSLNFDANKISDTGAGTDASHFGTASAFDSGVGSYAGVISTPSSGTDRVRIRDGSGGGAWGASVPFTWTNADGLSVNFKIPIEGWSAGAMLSTTEASFLSAKSKIFLNNSSTNQTISSATETQVLFDATQFDEGGMSDTGNNAIVIPASGYYEVKLNLFVASLAADDFIIGRVRVNNPTSGDQIIQSFQDYTGTIAQVQGSTIVFLNKGDSLTASVDSETDTSYTVNFGAIQSYLTVERRPNFSTFSVFGQTEYIAAELGTTQDTVAADTWEDCEATPTTITLTPGTWQIGYDVSVQMNRVAGTITPRANLVLATTGDVNVNDTIGYAQANLDATYTGIGFAISKQTEITIASTTSYKLRHRTNATAANQTIRVIKTDETGALTNPDSAPIIWARRIR
jgi:hypothetical protein